MTALIQSSEIITLLQREKILTPETGGKQTVLELKALRKMLPQEEVAKKLEATRFVCGVAMTLLGLGACQELVQRFAVEYFSSFPITPMSIIFAANKESDDSHRFDNHCFALIGEVKAEEGLSKIVKTIFAEEKFFISIPDFLAQQPEGTVLADPWLGFAGFANGPCLSFLECCRLYKITDIVGITQLSTSFMRLAPQIKADASEIAHEVKKRDWRAAIAAEAEAEASIYPAFVRNIFKNWKIFTK